MSELVTRKYGVLQAICCVAATSSVGSSTTRVSVLGIRTLSLESDWQHGIKNRIPAIPQEARPVWHRIGSIVEPSRCSRVSSHLPFPRAYTLNHVAAQRKVNAHGYRRMGRYGLEIFPMSVRVRLGSHPARGHRRPPVGETEANKQMPTSIHMVEFASSGMTSE